MVDAAAPIAADDALARRNAALLALTQACYGISASTIIMTGGLIGKTLATNAALATLPVSLMILGSAISTVPFSLLMGKVGRKAGFWAGATIGLLGSLLAAYAIWIGSFWLFCLGAHMNGYYQACAQYYRFAAADTASTDFKPKAISWVLVGGIASAVLGPQTALLTKDWMAPATFAGSYLAISGVTGVAIAIIGFLSFPQWREKLSADSGSKRPLSELLAQPRLLSAMAVGMVSYGLMSLVMTATPLAMLACNHSVEDAGYAIQWHILAMFAPSFFTGNLIARFGKEIISGIGLCILAVCGLVALSGIELMNFNLAMILLGLGWNFGFIGGTSMVTDCHTPAERSTVQGANDFVVFGFTAFCSFLSGTLLATVGWSGVNLVIFPMVGIAVLALVLAARSKGANAT